MLFDKEILSLNKYSDASKLIMDIVKPLKISYLDKKASSLEEKLHASYYKT